jgi:hypothetical protein
MSGLLKPLKGGVALESEFLEGSDMRGYDLSLNLGTEEALWQCEPWRPGASRCL